MSGKIAVVLVRGTIRANGNVKKALRELRLQQKHACAIVEDNAATRGSLALCKDYIAYGPVDAAMLKELAAHPSVKDKDGKDAHVFRLNPPRGGLGKSKKAYQSGGALGLRRETMSSLLKKMV